MSIPNNSQQDDDEQNEKSNVIKLTDFLEYEKTLIAHHNYTLAQVSPQHENKMFVNLGAINRFMGSP